MTSYGETTARPTACDCDCDCGCDCESDGCCGRAATALSTSPFAYTSSGLFAARAARTRSTSSSTL
jgi:hypothetical protein